MRKYIAFLKVVDCKSFTAAADELKYTQSAISQMINSLESELGAKLFIRSKHGLQLTYEGAQLLPYIRELVTVYKKLAEKSGSLKDMHSGIIRIATFATFSGSLLPAVLKGFKKMYPDIIFEFHQGYYNEIESWVNKDVVDFGITNVDNVKEFQSEFLFSDHFYAAFPEGNGFCQKSMIPLESLKSESFITLDDGDEKDYLNKLREMGIELNIKYHLCDDNSILAMVENGLGLAILPKLAIVAGRYNVHYAPIETDISRSIGIIYKNKSRLSKPSRIFINYLKEQLKGV